MKVVVLSPHLDDAALSIGGWIADATSRGHQVMVLTVLANDPASRLPASRWDRRCGFSSTGEAARARRREDERAMRVLGARFHWLPLGDREHGPPSRDAVLEAVRPHVREAELLVCPGYPLLHPDHGLVADAATGMPDIPLAYYVEQPYATTRLMGRGRGADSKPRSAAASALLEHAASRVARRRRAVPPVAPSGERFRAVAPTAGAQLRKHRAISQYASQRRPLGPFVRSRILLYEIGAGGEGLELTSFPPARS